MLFIRFHAVEKKNVSPPYLKAQMSTEFSPVNDNEDPSLRLSKREIEVLRCLTQSPGSIVTRIELADGEDISERAIDVQINRLRRKIETDPRDPLYLQTVRGSGYVLRTD